MKQRDYIWFFVNGLLGLLLQLLLSESLSWDLHFVSYPYVLPLLLVPMHAPEGRQLLAAALLGLLIDLLYGTLGVHIAATVVLTYSKGLVLRAFTPASLRESQVYPRPLYMGWSWYVIYLSILLFVHQACVFSLEAGAFLHTLYILSTWFKSLFLTWLFFVLLEVFCFLTRKPKKV